MFVAAMIVDVVGLLPNKFYCCHVIEFLIPFFTSNSYDDQGANVVRADEMRI